MKKTRWSDLFGTVLAGATVATVYTVGKKKAKKYGENPSKQKIIDVNIKDIIYKGIKAFVSTDDKKLEEITEFIIK